jgi:very-short-patch-repair endonuclease
VLQNGFQVMPQVGVAGFFIDLGVLHPAKQGTFLLGIECDGASYHSGRSARDRDRLRQEILESHGWKIYRIWSTDWFRSRDKEVQRLFKFIADSLASRAS